MKSFKFKSCCTVAVLLSIIFMIGCTKNDPLGSQKGPAPDIPPVSTFLMDFTVFPSSRLSKPLPTFDDNSDRLMSNKNWAFSAFQAGVWNTLITIGFAVPVAAFVESFNHEPEYRSDGTWVWTYQVPVNGVKHTAELHAKPALSGIQWEMYISKENAYSHFKWYDGFSNIPATEGSWTLYKSPEDQLPMIEIVWHRTPGQGTGDIRYTNVIPNGPENGGYIYYGKSKNDVYDAFYHIYNKGKDNLTVIEWNSTMKNGRVKDTQHFGDNDWHCWDRNLQDVDCQ